MRFTAAAVQIAPIKADYTGNVCRAAEAILRCSSEGADLAIFPETSLTGYFLEGGVEDVAVPAEQVVSDLWKALAGGLQKPIDVVVGFYERGDGHIYNSAAHIEFDKTGGRLKHVHRKFFLPTYGVFDEERFVSRGRDVSCYETRFGKFALLICEDIWHSITPTIAALKGALAIIAIAASPARGFSEERIGNLQTYRNLVSAFAQEHGVWGMNSMLVGFEGGKGFAGGSVVADPFGKIVAEGPIGEQHILLCEIDMDLVAIARQQSPLLSDLTSALEDVAREIQEVNDSTCK